MENYTVIYAEFIAKLFDKNLSDKEIEIIELFRQLPNEERLAILELYREKNS